MNSQTLIALSAELDRVTNAPQTGHYQLTDGSTVKAATESDVIKHLTGRFDFIGGRQYRFPGIGNGWRFSSSIEEAGYKIIAARTTRKNTPCHIIVKA